MSDGPPAGWFPDPNDASQERYWDGAAWGDTRPRPPQAAAPPPPPKEDAAPGAAEPEGPAGIRGRWNAAQERSDARAERIADKGRQRLTGGNENKFAIAEDGKNGTVEFGDKGIERLLKKTLGKDDRQFIPYSSIAMVSHDRKRFGRDVVEVQVGSKTYEWKIVADAEGFVDRLNGLIA